MRIVADFGFLCIENLYSIDIALRNQNQNQRYEVRMGFPGSKEIFFKIKLSSRQRRDISIEIGSIYRRTPAECYVC